MVERSGDEELSRRQCCVPLGTPEVAELLGVEAQTVWRWRTDGRFVEPTWPSVNAYPAWDRAEVIRWAGVTGRLRPAELERFPVRQPLVLEYVVATGEAPRAAGLPRRRRSGDGLADDGQGPGELDTDVLDE